MGAEAVRATLKTADLRAKRKLRANIQNTRQPVGNSVLPSLMSGRQSLYTKRQTGSTVIIPTESQLRRFLTFRQGQFKEQKAGSPISKLNVPPSGPYA